MKKKGLLHFNYNISYLFKKKKITKNYIFKKSNFILEVFKKLYIYYINIELFNVDSFFIKYNFIKNMWYLFLNLYKLLAKKIKVLLRNFFRFFLIKNLIKNLFIKKNLKKFLIISYNLKEIFKKRKNLLSFFFLKIKKKKKRELKIQVLLNNYLKYKVNKRVKLHMPLFFFNKYNRKKYIILINYFIYILNFNIKNKKAFINYWLRYFKYIFKRIYINIEFVLKRIFNILNKWYYIFCLLMNLKKIKKKKFFFFYFFYNNYKYRFLKKNKIYEYFINIKRFLEKNFYKKVYYNIFFFNISKGNKFILYSFKNLKNLIKIKFLIVLKNFFFSFILRFLIYWCNNFLSIENYHIHVLNFNITLKYLYKNLIYFKNNKLNNLLFLKYNYFFFSNIVK